ncbi:MAG: magnesium transporter [Acinetobacter sp.]|nr:magnesium transporter [Acinetobacter sp.]
MNRQVLALIVRELAITGDAQAFAETLRNTHPSDFVEALEVLSVEATLDLIMTLDAYARAGLFVHFPETLQDALLLIMPRAAVVQLFEEMPSDDRADLFNRLSDEAKESLLPALTKVERDDILRLASYPEGIVGSVTTSDYVAVSPEMTVAAALAHIRVSAPDKETIYIIYVLDNQLRLCGSVSLRDLVLAKDDTLIQDIMHADPVYARAHWPSEEATALIRRYDLLALPVLSGERMIGIVTVDDAMDIDKEQDATQLAKFGGTTSLGGPDLDVISSPFSKMFGVRVFWLSVLTFFGVLTSTYVAAQEEILTEVIVLAAFIAPIVDMGGNTGSQSATLVIRAMALGDLTLKWRDVWFMIKRELPVAAALGLAIALLEVVLSYFAKGVGFDVLMVVGLSMLICTVLGGVVGAMLPFAARRLGTDPATLSAPLITSFMDLIGVFIYFAIAYAFLGHLLA